MPLHATALHATATWPDRDHTINWQMTTATSGTATATRMNSLSPSILSTTVALTVGAHAEKEAKEAKEAKETKAAKEREDQRAEAEGSRVPFEFDYALLGSGVGGREGTANSGGAAAARAGSSVQVDSADAESTFSAAGAPESMVDANAPTAGSAEPTASVLSMGGILPAKKDTRRVHEVGGVAKEEHMVPRPADLPKDMRVAQATPAPTTRLSTHTLTLLTGVALRLQSHSNHIAIT